MSLDFSKKLKLLVKKVAFSIKAISRMAKYTAAKIQYRLDGNTNKTHFQHPREIGLIKIDPLNNDTVISLPSDYLQLVDKINEKIDKKMIVAKNWIYTLANKELKRKLNDVAGPSGSVYELDEFKAGLIERIISKECDDIHEIEELCQKIMPEVEKNVYGSYVEIASYFVERKFALKERPEKTEKFHADRHYEDTVRMIIYLSDVDDGAAPFEYIRNKLTQKTIRIKTADHPKYTLQGRIPSAAIDNYLNNGYERINAVGKKGTIILFDSKIIHKANLAKHNDRLALVLPIRPSIKKPTRYTDPSHIEAVYV